MISHLDGRHKRKEENKKRSIETILDMMLETGKEPTIDEIVERSGVSRRSVFHYFNNRKVLIGEINNLLLFRIQEKFSYGKPDRNSSLSRTLEDFLKIRIQIFEYIAPIKMITEEKRRANSLLEDNFKELMSLERNLIREHFFHFLENRDDKEDLLHLIMAGLSWNNWSFFRYDCNFDREKSLSLMTKQILAIAGQSKKEI